MSIDQNNVRQMNNKVGNIVCNKFRPPERIYLTKVMFSSWNYICIGGGRGDIKRERRLQLFADIKC